jgi:hypothetical protein
MKKLNFLLIAICLSSNLLAQNVFDNNDSQNAKNIFETENSNAFNNNQPSSQEEIDNAENSKFGADGPGAPEPVPIEMYIPYLFCIAISGIIAISIYKKKQQNIKI